MEKLILIVAATLLFASTACDTINPVACTEEFRSITVEITGADIDKTFTITNDGDTIHREDPAMANDFYTIIDDGTTQIEDNEEVDVSFHAYKGDSLLVDEPYVVGRDECHVYKESGKVKIEL
ncbi:MAG: hypothetical protein MRZ79_05035 [Bacteroidia bacterium]|nr:hypothetical protein [Bacteroidia bacterium]